MFDKLLEFVVSAVRAEEKAKFDKEREAWAEDVTRPRDKGQFWCTRRAGDLVEPCKKRALVHRDREQVWTKRLEEAEKELKEKGVSVEVYDAQTQTFNYANICSGSLTGVQQTFQPRVDQRYMDAVKNAKSKMLEHRSAAEGYEKQARAFALNPDFVVRLSTEDVHYFRLEA